MSKGILYLLALLGGSLLAMQGGINSRLGVLLSNPLLAALVAFTTSSIYALVLALTTVRSLPSKAVLSGIPTYLWLTGGLCSVAGLYLYFYTIPRLGISTMIAFGLGGQLIFSVIAGHFGWFHLPVQPIDIRRLIGVVVMLIGIVLITQK